jgi:hypothetical protein
MNSPDNVPGLASASKAALTSIFSRKGNRRLEHRLGGGTKAGWYGDW